MNVLSSHQQLGEDAPLSEHVHKIVHGLSWVSEHVHASQDLCTVTDHSLTFAFPEVHELGPEELSRVLAHGPDCCRRELLGPECLLKRPNVLWVIKNIFEK